MYDTTVTVVGNIASDVSSRRVGDDGQLVVSFRVASTARRRDRMTGEWMDGDRFAARVSCWRALGEGVMTSLAKGDPVVVSGRVSVREYEVEGERRFSTEIAADSVGPDLARSSAHVRRRRPVSADDASVGDAVEPALGIGAGFTSSGSDDDMAVASVGSTPTGWGRDHAAPDEVDESVGVLATTG